MLRTAVAFIVGVGLGAAVVATASQSRGIPSPGSRIVQLRLYTIDKGRLDDFAKAWLAVNNVTFARIVPESTK